MAAKGYWIGNITINDMDKVMEYRNANRERLNRYGANFIIMHGQQKILDPPVPPSWTAIGSPLTRRPWRVARIPGYYIGEAWPAPRASVALAGAGPNDIRAECADATIGRSAKAVSLDRA